MTTLNCTCTVVLRRDSPPSPSHLSHYGRPSVKSGPPKVRDKMEYHLLFSRWSHFTLYRPWQWFSRAFWMKALCQSPGGGPLLPLFTKDMGNPPTTPETIALCRLHQLCLELLRELSTHASWTSSKTLHTYRHRNMGFDETGVAKLLSLLCPTTSATTSTTEWQQTWCSWT